MSQRGSASPPMKAVFSSRWIGDFGTSPVSAPGIWVTAICAMSCSSVSGATKPRVGSGIAGRYDRGR